MNAMYRKSAWVVREPAAERDLVMSTTAIRLSEELKARVARAARRTGTTVHGFILEAIAEKTDQVERRADFHDEARAWIAHEALYYSATSKALAERFTNAVEDVVALASRFPEMGARYKHGTRRFCPRRFPFSVVYVERRDEIYVLALAPFSRRPGYWRSRLSTIR